MSGENKSPISSTPEQLLEFMKEKLKQIRDEAKVEGSVKRLLDTAEKTFEGVQLTDDKVLEIVAAKHTQKRRGGRRQGP